jgi:CheY-like chemotaxis protein
MISDVGLPDGMRGPELVQHARQARPDLSFLYISGYARPAVEQSGALSDGIELISKPFRKAAFAKRVREILDRRTEGRQ